MERWLPLVDYSVKTGISLSSLRRYIKSNKVKFRLDKGKYLIYDSEKEYQSSETESLDFRIYCQKLEAELREKNKENIELKMLVAFYEEQSTRNEPTC